METSELGVPRRRKGATRSTDGRRRFLASTRFDRAREAELGSAKLARRTTPSSRSCRAFRAAPSPPLRTDPFRARRKRSTRCTPSRFVPPLDRKERRRKRASSRSRRGRGRSASEPMSKRGTERSESTGTAPSRRVLRATQEDEGFKAREGSRFRIEAVRAASERVSDATDVGRGTSTT